SWSFVFIAFDDLSDYVFSEPLASVSISQSEPLGTRSESYSGLVNIPMKAYRLSESRDINYLEWNSVYQ
ncbi:MAG: hypothetical protein MHPSP_004694, partial [Paramarteilia canceri]